MGHSEISQSPTETGDHADDIVAAVTVLHQIQKVGTVSTAGFQSCCQRGSIAGQEMIGKQRYCQDTDQHQHTLDKVCHTYRGKSAEEGIDQNYQRTDGQCHMIINTEHGLKQLTAGRKRGSAIYQEKYYNSNRRNRHQYLLLIMEAVLKISRQRNGIVGADRISAQLRGNEQPVQRRADEKSDGDPAVTSDTG